MKDIVLITNYWHFECEKDSARYSTLANMIVKGGFQLEVITSTFYHGTKSQRSYDASFLESFPYRITLQYEPGYSRNVCLGRFHSQAVFAKNVISYLKKRRSPDVIYCVIPSTDVAYKVSKFAKKNGITFILDIQDLWPEAFKVALNIPIVSDIAFCPIKRKANIAYSNADMIVAVSQTYVDRAKKINNKCKKAIPVYLGIELDKFCQIANSRPFIRKKDDGFWIAYIGTLGHSYDIKCVIRAIKALKDRGISDVFFYVMGYGPLEKEFKDYAVSQGVEDNVIFTGKLAYADMVKKLCECDIAINPIVHNAAQSITNKHGDYFASGLPIISTQESDEFRSLLDKYQAGINCRNGDFEELADKILYLRGNPSIRLQMGQNSSRVACELFDRNRTYNEIVDLLRDKTGVFICHTYYHILIAVVEKLTIYRDVEMDLALAYSSTNLNGIENNISLKALFHSVYVISEKEKSDMEHERKKHYTARTKVGKILLRGWITKKFGRYVGNHLENDFKRYDNIRLFCDPDPIGYYFYSQGIRYYAVEDALNSFQNDIMAGWRTQLWAKKILNRIGMLYIPHGYSWNCLGVEVNDANKVCANPEKLIVVNRKQLFDKLDDEARRTIVAIFKNDLCEVKTDSNMCLFLTQPLYPNYFHSVDEQIDYFKNILSKYGVLEERLCIKVHPRDLTDYQYYFPNSLIFDRTYPIELLNLLPDVKFKMAVTIFSTALDALNFVKEKHEIGYQSFLDYIRRLYEKSE